MPIPEHNGAALAEAVVLLECRTVHMDGAGAGVEHPPEIVTQDVLVCAVSHAMRSRERFGVRAGSADGACGDQKGCDNECELVHGE